MLVNKYQKILKKIFFFGLLAMPLIFWPWAEIPYEIPKAWFFQRWVEVLVILAVLGRSKLQKDSFILLVMLFLLAALASSFFGVDFKKSFLGNYYRSDGLLTLFHLAALFFFLKNFWEKSWRKSTAVSIVLGCFLTSIWTIFLGIRFHLLKDLSVYRFGKAIGGTFGQPNFLAGYLLVTLPFIVFLLNESGKKIQRNFWRLILLSQILAIFLTLSRAAILGVVLLAVGWLGLNKQRKIKILALVGIIVVLLAAVFLLMATEGRWAPEGRERIFQRGVIAFSKRPILGWGWANFDYAFEAINWPIKVKNDVYVDKAHSNFLEVLVTTGITGILIYFIIIIKVIAKIFSRALMGEGWGKTLLLAFLLFCYHSQTNVISINEDLVFWLILGII